MPWTTADLPDLTGQVFVITGANSGLGLEATRRLAEKGATVVMACRSAQRAEAVAAPLREAAPAARLEVMTLDLSSLDGVARFAEALASRFPRVDVLMNNAGVMALPYRKTADGFELQFGTNHLGHFALTARVLPLLEASGRARVVSVSSMAHRMGAIRFDDLHWERAYAKWPAYGQSKLANLLFTYELERWLRRHGKATIAVAAHPGYSATNLQAVGPQMESSAVGAFFMRLSNALLAQPAERGVLPQLYAAVHPGVKGGQYIGPDGFMEMSGFPRVVDSNPASKDEGVAARLWEASAALTGVAFTP
ncbi:MAG: SDR family oxidoreductase [Myxococcaceae bacterium]|nr:SDR family oxidoreductase [Myxococcaceae bacterium]MCA3012194.1 SDR family oxidoreductase [Myxococcaceae bacterium]